MIDVPYPFYRRLHAHAPVWQIADTGLFAISTFELLAEATSRADDFSSNISCLLYRDDAGVPRRFSYGNAGPQALATADPPMHALHRSTVFPELVAKRMAELEPDIIDTANRCVTRALDAGAVDFMAEIGNVVPITMISRLIGFHDADDNQLLRAAFDSTAMLGSSLSLDELTESSPTPAKSRPGSVINLRTRWPLLETISLAQSPAALRMGCSALSRPTSSSTLS